MKFFSIVSEFNPFHTGHKYLIEQTKAKTGTDGIVCIMSGSMVQRGDVAIYDKWTRAKAAVENGADLVVELPVCYVLQSADIFAKGAVELANLMGAEGIAFGSECADRELLMKMAKLKINEPPEYSDALKAALAKGEGYPSACHIAAQSVLGELPREVSGPNATLGIAYLKAREMINPNLKVHIQKRNNEYHSTEPDGVFSSATALRHQILKNDQTSKDLLCTSDEIYDINKISAYILGFLRSVDPASLENISGMEPGLPQRLTDKSRESSTLQELVEMCTTKRYTAHRIRRVILCSILGINCAPSPRYVRVLALNNKGAEILKDIKKRNNIEIITKITKSSNKNSSMLIKDILATDIASLCIPKKASMDYTTTPIVTRKD